MIALLAKITSLLALEMTDYMLICVCACALIGAVTGFVVYSASKRKNNKRKEETTPATKVSADVEEIKTEAVAADELVMSRNVIYSAGLDGQLKAGQYALKNSDSSAAKFNVRLNGLVKEYVNGDIVTLADGDTISPVSGSVLISKLED